MFAMILAMIVSGNSDDRMPEISLDFTVKKISMVRDSLKVKAPEEVTWNDMNKLDPESIRVVEKPTEKFVIIYSDFN
jgi:hypothetical protein